MALGDPDPQRVMQFEVRALESTGQKFESLASEYAGSMKNGKAPFNVPNSGEKSFDDLLGTVLRLFSEVHELTAYSIHNHGVKLKMAAEHYDRAEESTVNSLLDLARTGDYAPYK